MERASKKLLVIERNIVHIGPFIKILELRGRKAKKDS